MTQNTEQNVRTRREQVEELTLDLNYNFSNEAEEVLCAERHILEAEARGAEEQRQNEQEAVAWVRPSALPCQDYPWYETELHLKKSKRYSMALYSRPANVAALEAEIASLKEAEQLARADAEASKANAGWNFLTENVSSDPKLPSCRLSTLFQEGDELSRFQRAAQEFGIEVRLVTDDREDEDCDKALSVEILSKFDPCQFLIRDGWSFVDVWENDDGGIIRLFARAALTREGGV